MAHHDMSKEKKNVNKSSHYKFYLQFSYIYIYVLKKSVICILHVRNLHIWTKKYRWTLMLHWTHAHTHITISRTLNTMSLSLETEYEHKKLFISDGNPPILVGIIASKWCREGLQFGGIFKVKYVNVLNSDEVSSSLF